MRIKYRGFDLYAERTPKSDEVAYGINRIADGLELDFGFDYDSVRNVISWMKKDVDEAIATNGESAHFEPDIWNRVDI